MEKTSQISVQRQSPDVSICLHYLFSIPTSSARTYACCVPACTHIPGLKSVINIKSPFPLILQHKTSPYIPMFEVVCLLTFMRHCVLCHAVVGSVPYATVRHKRIIKPLVSYCLLEGKSILTENHSPMPFIYPVWYCLVSPMPFIYPVWYWGFFLISFVYFQ